MHPQLPRRRKIILGAMISEFTCLTPSSIQEVIRCDTRSCLRHRRTLFQLERQKGFQFPETPVVLPLSTHVHPNSHRVHVAGLYQRSCPLPSNCPLRRHAQLHQLSEGSEQQMALEQEIPRFDLAASRPCWPQVPQNCPSVLVEGQLVCGFLSASAGSQLSRHLSQALADQVQQKFLHPAWLSSQEAGQTCSEGLVE